nr:hypothetical protein [Ralstonia insidiosa]
MSWLFSRALVEAYSPPNCSDGQPSAPLSAMPTPHKFWHNGKTMECSSLSRFGLTCRVLTEDLGEALLTSFLAASRAKTSASLGKAQESMASAADSGRRWPGLLARYSHDLCLWKTAQSSLLGDLDEFSETWPRFGMTRNGVSYQRQTLKLRTSASDFGLWPTPTVHGNHNKLGASQKSGWGLSSAVKLWPTPVASDTGSRSAPYAQGGTPLSLAVKLWPTPTAMTRTGGAALCKWGGSRSREKLRTMVTSEELNGPLNPQWVEWLMGWPIGWTDLQPLAMDKYREWLQQHGGYSAEKAA